MKIFSLSRSLVVSLLVIAVFAGCGPQWSHPNKTQESYTPPFVDSVKIIRLARNNDFKELESLLTNYQSNYEEDVNQELSLEMAFGTFRNSDPVLETHLNKWVNKYPASYIAKIARGNYLLQKGINARGFNAAQNTAEQQFRSMEEYFRLAEKDYEDAIKIYPRSLSSYVGLVIINQTSGASDSVQPLISNRLTIHPGSIRVRSTALFYQQPKWGGTPDALDKMMAEVESSSKKYENLRTLTGYKDYLAGEDAFGMRQYSIAQEFYLKALMAGYLPEYRIKLASAYCYDNKYDQALIEINKVLSERPHSREALLTRVIIYRLSGRCDKAQDDIKLFLEIDPTNVYILRNQASCAFQTR